MRVPDLRLDNAREHQPGGQPDRADQLGQAGGLQHPDQRRTLRRRTAPCAAPGSAAAGRRARAAPRARSARRPRRWPPRPAPTSTGVEAAGCPAVAEPGGQGALADAGVAGDVAQVVGHQDRAGQRTDRRRRSARWPGRPGRPARTRCRRPPPGRRRRRRTPRRARGSRTGAGRRCRTRRRARRPTPTASSHQWPVSTTSTSPASPATAKLTRAARLTAAGAARPEPTRRSGPTRSASVPRMPSE